METKNKFSLLKDEMLDIKAEEALPYKRANLKM